MSNALFEHLCSLLQPERLARMDDVLAVRTRHITVVLENLYRTQNASACLRNCEAFGVQDVHVISEGNPFKVNRDIAQGTAQWLSIDESTPSTVECFAKLRQRGYRIVAVSGRQSAGPLADYDPTPKTALVFGNERDGLSETAMTSADEIRDLPMFGFAESFNLSVAVALSLGTVLPKVRVDEMAWSLTEPEKQELRERWVRKSVGYRVDAIEREFLRREADTQ